MKGFSGTVNNKILHRANLSLVFILCLGFALRFFWVMTLDDNISWEDEADYMALSEKITAGEGFVNTDGTPTAFRAAGYPVFLSVLRFAGFRDPFGIRLVQVYLGTLIIWLVYMLGREIFDRKTGKTAAFVTAIYPYYIYMPGTILAATLLTGLILLATWVLHKAVMEYRLGMVCAGGFIMGLAVLTKPSAITFVVAVVAWLVYVFMKDSRKRLIYAVLFAVTVLLTITPWMIRNYVKLDTPVLTTNMGRNLWLGNNPLSTANTGSSIKMSNFLERKIDLAGSETNAEKIYIDEAKNFIVNHPGKFILLTIQKGLGFWRWTPSPTTGGYGQQHLFLYWSSILSFGPVFLLALTGFVFTTPERRKQIMLWIYYILFFTLLHAFFISKVRFRLPLDVFLIMMAASTLFRLKEVFYKCKNELFFIFKSNTGYVFNRMEKISNSSRKAKE
ncbi:glycosyltransferase family 39 protein [candidate division KSB1 bacterium]|nr:glycosyltransferase family 39 protein [candidate division KSB1 bacterium]